MPLFPFYKQQTGMPVLIVYLSSYLFVGVEWDYGLWVNMLGD